MTREEREERLAYIRGGKIENLPKWAQNRIQILERDLLDLEDKWTDGPESDTHIANYSHGDKPIGVGTTILFGKSEDVVGKRGIPYQIACKWEDGKLEVRGYSGRICVNPAASNLITVKVEKY